MKRVLCALALSLLVAPALPAEQASARSPPSVLNHYWIYATIDDESMMVNGTEIINFTNTNPQQLNDLALKIYANAFIPDGWISILSVESGDGAELEFTMTEIDNTTLMIDLPHPLGMGEEVEVRIEFAIKIPERKDRFGHYQGILALGNWFPILAVYEDGRWVAHPYYEHGEAFYSESADYDVWLNVSEDLVVAATGVLVEERSQGDGTKLQHWVASRVRDFAIAASRKYELEKVRWENVTIYSYYLPESEDAGRQAAVFAKEAIEAYSERFGRYPFEEFRVVEVDGWFGGMEYPTFIMIAHYLYTPRNAYSFEMVIAHEVGHQWWFSMVGNDQNREPWLDEAVTEYTGIAYFEFVYGEESYEEAFDQFVKSGYYQYLNSYADLEVARPVPEFDDPYAYYRIVYGKGACVMRLLRHLMGDEAFFEGLRILFERNKFGVATASDFISAMEESYGADLDWFFDQWLFGVGVSTYHLDNVSFQQIDGGYLVRLRIRQEVRSSLSPQSRRLDPIELPVQVEVVCREGRRVDEIWINESTLDLSLSVPEEPMRVILDPNDYIPGHDGEWRANVTSFLPIVGKDATYSLLKFILLKFVMPCSLALLGVGLAIIEVKRRLIAR